MENLKKSLKIAVTGASGRVAYSLIDKLCNGQTFGHSTEIDLILNCTPNGENLLKGLKMELHDMGYPLLRSVKISLSDETAFVDVDLAIFLGSVPQLGKGKRSDFLIPNGKIFSDQGKAL